MKTLPKLSLLALAFGYERTACSNKLWTLVSLLLASASVHAGVQTVDNTETVIYKENIYSIDNMSLWSSEGPTRKSVAWELTEAQWDKVFGRPPRVRLGVGGIIEECLLGVCVKAGAAAGIEAEAYVLPYLNAEFEPGTFNATAAYQPTVQYQYSGLGVDFFTLNTDSGFNSENSSFTVKAPSFELETGLNVNANLNLFAEACLLGCFVDETYNLANFEIKVPLLKIDTIDDNGGDPKAIIFSPPTNPVELANLLIDLVENPPSSIADVAETGLYSDISAIISKTSEAAWDKYKSDLEEKGKTDPEAKKKLDNIKKAESLIAASPISLDFSNPYTENATGEWGGAGNKVATASIGGDFLDIKLDLDQVLGYAFGLPNGGTMSLEDAGIKNSPINAEVTLFDIQAGPVVSLETDLTLSPELMVTLDFSAPVLIKGEIGAQTSYTGAWSDIPQIALLAPDSTKTNVRVEGLTPNTNPEEFKIDQLFSYGEKVYATPTFFVEATLANRTYIDVRADIDISGLEATVGIDGFDDLTIGPAFDKTFSSGSLAQIDIYNNTFNTGAWDSPTGDNKNVGTERSRLNGEAPINSNSSESLSFDSAGEIIFQARSVGDAKYDIAYTDGVLDDRIKQYVSVDGLILSEKNRRMYDYKPFEGTEIIADKLFYFNKTLVADAVNNEYKIDSGQSAQVMTDGQLRTSYYKDFIVEVGGSLELAAKHPYGALTNVWSPGFYNVGKVEVYGDIYMGGGVLNENAANQYKYSNTGTTTIGASGSVKFDGKFENAQYGTVDNYGRFELTGNNNESNGVIKNRFDGEFDLFGNLTVSSTSRNTPAISNDGALTLYSGAEMSFGVTGGQNATAEIRNNGNLAVQKNAELVLRSNTTDTGTAKLTNSHVIDNSGVIWNQSGNEIVNGKAGNDWSSYRGKTDVLVSIQALRDTNIGALDANYQWANYDASVAAFEAAGDKQRFLSAMNTYMTSAEIRLDKPKPGTGDGYEGYKTAYDEAKIAKSEAQTNYDDFLTYYNSQNHFIKEILKSTYDAQTAKYNSAVSALAYRKGAFEQQIVFKTNALRDDRMYKSAYDIRQTESNYSDSLQNSADRRADASNVYQQIDAKLSEQANSGIGVLVNQSGGMLRNDGSLTNHSIILNKTGGEIYNTKGAEINNDGGYLRNSGLLVNQAGARLTNTGVIDNGMSNVRNTFGILEMAQIVNLGRLDNTGEIVNNDTMVNYVEINNGIANLKTPNAFISNAGIMSNLGLITNNARIENKVAAELNNHATIVNNGTITNDGVFNNGQNPNNGKNPGDAGYINTFSIAAVIADANAFYAQKQNVRSLDNDLAKLQEQVKDSKARESLVVLQQIPLLPNYWFNSFANMIITQQNNALRTSYYASLALAKNETAILQGMHSTTQTQQNIANSTMRNLDSVSIKTYQDKNGNTIEGAPYINLAAITSVNSAHLINNGEINNRGLLNNVGTITNNETGNVHNSGILMVGQQGKINNAGNLIVESTTINGTDARGSGYSYEQEGMLISNGTIINSGLIEITAGTLVNGTLEDTLARIENSGEIKLSGSVEMVTDQTTLQKTLSYSTASLINQATIDNQTGGLIKIGEADPTVVKNGLYSINTLANFGQINNASYASIENYGLLLNAGEIDNQKGSSFTNKGLLNNTKNGKITFADATTLDGYVVNNGLLVMSDEELLTLTGNVSGNGVFSGNTFIKGDVDVNGKYTASVNPGNSPGLLTFDGDVTAENVNWVMEVWGTDRGIGYDGIDIFGDFSLAGGMSLSILSLLDFDTLISQEFTFFSITGDLFDSVGTMITSSFEFFDFSIDMGSNWAGNWINDIGGGWNLNLSYVADNIDMYKDLRTPEALSRLQKDPTEVPEPSTLMMLILAMMLLVRNKGMKVRCL